MIRPQTERKTRVIIWMTQFVASLIALSLPPFFALFLPKTFSGTPSWLGGVAFAAPLALSAWMSPFWGRLADRYGRLSMAIRAHLGLSLALIWAASAHNIWEFLAAMLLQGALGGTYSANRAILLESVAPSQRARALEELETAPRIALILGPLVASLLGPSLLHSRFLYSLAVLPMLCAGLLYYLCRARPSPKPELNREGIVETSAFAGPAKSSTYKEQLDHSKVAIFALFFGGGIFAPFAVTWTVNQNPALPLPAATFLALLPNIVFSISALLPRCELKTPPPPLQLGMRLLLQSAVLAALVICTNSVAQLLVRLLYSVLFVSNWRRIHAEFVHLIPCEHLGRATGELDSVQRWSALLGSAIASLLWGSISLQFALPLCAGGMMAAVVFYFIYIKKGVLSENDAQFRYRSI